MKTSRWRNHRGFKFAGVTVAAVAAVVAGLAAPALARPSAVAGTSSTSAGYPPPKGIYAQYTNCPLKNPLMHESIDVTVCTWGHATSGSVTIGTTTTPVTEPVTVQFGWYDSAPIHFNYPLPTVSPLSGATTITSTKPDLIPESLTTALGCPSTNATVENICQEAAATPADNQVFALAQSTGPITAFNLFTWAQPVKFELINPLLGKNCSIGTNDSPIVLHPQLSLLPGGSFSVVLDPNGLDVGQILLTGAQAADSTFSAPGVTGCGPGGPANIAVESALDAGVGLPATSGNSLTLQGNFDLAIGAGPENFPNPVPQPADGAAELLQAFQASTSGEHAVKHLITMDQVKSMLHFSG